MQPYGIKQEVIIDEFEFLKHTVDTLSEEAFAVLIATTIKRSQRPSVIKELLLQKLNSIHSLG